MRTIVGAVLLAGLPVLALAQQPAQVPPILQAGAGASAGAAEVRAAAGASAPSDHAGGSATALASVGSGGATAFGATGPAAGVGAVPAKMPPPIRLLSPSAPLNPKESRGIGLARRWAAAPYMPHADADGVIRFPFGATLPTVVCAPWQSCDLALQPGEVINNISLGDANRWLILPGVSGSPAGQISHIVIKPSDAGLVSSLTIYTDRRTYAVKLVSTQARWMPLVGFTYRDDAQAQWGAYRATVGVSMATGAGGFGAAGAGNLDFGFRLAGDAPSWRPLRVYSDGAKTYIQFPHTIAFGAAPALVGLSSGGGWFSSPAKQMVNYRIAGDRYVVDQVLDRAELVSGVGSGQQRVLITRDGAK